MASPSAEEITVLYDVVSDIATCKRDAVLKYEFKGTEWRYIEKIEGGIEEIRYNEGCAFEATEARIRSDLYANPITVRGSYGNQSVRIDEELLQKLHVVSDYEGRSINRHILVLIRENIRAFEQLHGKIEGQISPDVNVKPTRKG